MRGGFNGGSDVALEAARTALIDGRNLLAEGSGPELDQLLVSKFTNPIAGIIGAHLMLIARAQKVADPRFSPQMFDIVIRNLRQLVGTDHPDVEALAFQCADPTLRPQRP